MILDYHYPKELSLIIEIFWEMVMRFEHRASCLLGRHSAAQITFPALMMEMYQ
jgi:hypothetical protein